VDKPWSAQNVVVSHSKPTVAPPGNWSGINQHLSATEFDRLQFSLVYLYRNQAPVYARSGTFAPAWYSCWWMERGRVEVHFADGRHCRARTGDWLLLPPGVTRTQLFSDRSRIHSIAFRMRWSGSGSWRTNLPLTVWGDGAKALGGSAQNLFAQFPGGAPCQPALPTADPMQPAAALRHRAAAHQFYAAWSEVVGLRWSETAAEQERLVTDARVEQGCAILHKHCKMGPVPYGALADGMGVGRPQIDRLFQAALGRTPKEELNRRLLQKADEQLSDPRRSVKAIAYELGFTDPSHFCKWFKLQTGVLPSAYRAGWCA